MTDEDPEGSIACCTPGEMGPEIPENSRAVGTPFPATVRSLNKSKTRPDVVNPPPLLSHPASRTRLYTPDPSLESHGQKLPEALAGPH